MNYIAAAISDQGTKREVNQDALMIRNKITGLGNTCICVVCDGMGGLTQGEVASAHVIRRISDWFMYKTGSIKRFDKFVFYLERELIDASRELMTYGRNCGFVIGTTTTILLMAGQRFAIIHVGDTRVYEVSGGICVRIKQKTTDQSVNDYMLTQSVGATECLAPQVIFGRLKRDKLFLLCTDGFRHKNQPWELRKGFNPAEIKDIKSLEKKLRIFVDRARKLGETDDISVMGIKVV